MSGRNCFALLLVAALAEGCVVHTGDPRPGPVVLETPPTHPSLRAIEAPLDPGEHRVVVRPGFYQLVGADIPTRSSRTSRGSFQVGSEVTLTGHDADESHTEYQHFVLDSLALAWEGDEIALNLGWSWLSMDLSTEEARFAGPLYAELQWMAAARQTVPFSLAAGPFLDPRGGHPDGFDYGGQVSAAWATLFFRASYSREGDAMVLGGMVFKVPFMFVRSR
jgi:hypothetical protein